MGKVDDLGIELDEELERITADPKSAVLSKAVDYFVKRNEVKRQKEAEEKEKSSKKEGMFGGMFE